ANRLRRCSKREGAPPQKVHPHRVAGAVRHPDAGRDHQWHRDQDRGLRVQGSGLLRIDMGKLFAVVVVLITLVSAAIFASHIWWLPVDISAHGQAIGLPLTERMAPAGWLF